MKKTFVTFTVYKWHEYNINDIVRICVSLSTQHPNPIPKSTDLKKIITVKKL